MPQEKIGTSNPGEPFEAVVRWTPSLHLQVGIETVQGHHLLDVLTGRTEDTHADDETEGTGEHGPMWRIGRAVEAVVLDYQSRQQGSYSELGGLIIDAITGNLTGFTGLWVTLERPNVQRLIKALRRARNAVWGADE